MKDAIIEFLISFLFYAAAITLMIIWFNLSWWKLSIIAILWIIARNINVMTFFDIHKKDFFNLLIKSITKK